MDTPLFRGAKRIWDKFRIFFKKNHGMKSFIDKEKLKELITTKSV